MIWLIASLPNELNRDELLLRAVYPLNQRPNFWKDGRLSGAALKDSRGLSVERTHTRSVEESVNYMLTHLSGNIVAITQESCESVSAVVVYLPTQNIYHCEIHGSKEKLALNPRQAREIARSASVVYSVTIRTT